MHFCTMDFFWCYEFINWYFPFVLEGSKNFFSSMGGNGNEIHKQHGFFLTCMCVDVIGFFAMDLIIMIKHKKYAYL